MDGLQCDTVDESGSNDQGYRINIEVMKKKPNLYESGINKLMVDKGKQRSNT